MHRRPFLGATAEMLDDCRRVPDWKDLDAVIIGSPDSWHVSMMMQIASRLDRVRTRKEPNAPVRSCAAAAKAAHLGNGAYRQGSRTTWKDVE